MNKSRNKSHKKLTKVKKAILGASSLLLGSCATTGKTNKRNPNLQSVSINATNSTGTPELTNIHPEEITPSCDLLDNLKDTIDRLGTQIGDKYTLLSSEKNKYIEWKIKQIRSYIESSEESNSKLEAYKERLNTLEEMWKKEKGKSHYERKRSWLGTSKTKKEEELSTMLSRWEELNAIKEAQPNAIKDLEYDKLVEKIVSRITLESKKYKDMAFIRDNNATLSAFIEKNQGLIKAKIKNDIDVLQKTYATEKLYSIIIHAVRIGFIGALVASISFLFISLLLPFSILLPIIVPLAGFGIGAIVGIGIGNYHHSKDTEKRSKSLNQVIKDIDNGKNEIKYDHYVLENTYVGERAYNRFILPFI